MQGIFHLGGWGMYPTTIAGAALVLSALAFARNPDRRKLQLVIWLDVLTLLVGFLGFVSGVIHSTVGAAGLPSYEMGPVVIGIGESLVNVGYGLAFVVFATVFTIAGVYRGKRAPGGSELVDPTV